MTSGEGRAQAAAITALMTGHAYATSAKIANRVGPFVGFHKDRENVLNVLRMHRDEVSKVDASLVSEELLSAAASSWDEAVELGEMYGIRNSQASLLAPTGTTGLMMDCDTTGIEPDLGLVKTKKLVGGGSVNIVSPTISRALKALGYTKQQIAKILEYIDIEKTILGAPGLKPEHNEVFACSIGDNVIHYTGHVKMMAAVQPFLSGAISKTVSMPEETTVEEIEQLNIDAWKAGLKAIAIYRDNCKVAQLPSTDKKDSETDSSGATEQVVADNSTVLTEKIYVRSAVRKELPKTRSSKTFSLTVADSHGYLTVGEYEDGTPGEIFISFAKHGSTLRGIMDTFAISVSHGLQYGVPLKDYVKSFLNMSFAPAGATDDPDIRTASSLADFIARRLAFTYLPFDDLLELGLKSIEDMPVNQTSLLDVSMPTSADQISEGTVEPDLAASIIVSSTQEISEPIEEPKVAHKEVNIIKDNSSPLCFNCGNQTQRAGSCYVCTACGSTTGCS